MRISLEWFLLDNFAVNWLLLKLAGALGGVTARPGKAAFVSLLGALWDLAALGKWPRLLSLPGRIVCLLATALLLSRREYLRALLSLFASSLLLGGGLLLLTMGPAFPRTSGPLPVGLSLRAAIYGLCLLPLMVRAVRHLTHRGYEGSCTRTVALTVGGRTFSLVALVDSGNLLTEPLSGLPVVLTEGIELPPGRPLAVAGQGIIEVVRATVQTGPDREPVPVFAGRSPLPLKDFQALLPGAALHEGRREHVQKTQSVLLSALRPLVHPAVSLLFGPHRREPASTPVAGGGALLHHPGGQGKRRGPKQAHRAQPEAGGVHRPEV